MVLSNQIMPGMVLSIVGKLYRVESSVKVTVPKGQPFIKTRLRNLASDKVSEKNFKVGQEVSEVALQERRLEYLYLEGGDYLFLDLDNLDQVLVSPEIIGDKTKFLKEGIELHATFYGDTVFSVLLPQFLELMVAKVIEGNNGAVKKAVLETGAEIEVPRFIETGDVIKVDPHNKEFIQRV